MSAVPNDTPAQDASGVVRARLLRLRRPPSQSDRAGRALTGATPQAVARMLATEIDETVLPRRLTLSLATGATLGLIVAGRRVVALAGSSDTAFANPDEAADQVRAAFAAIIAPVTDARLRSARLPGMDGRSVIGCDAARLAARLGIEDWAAAGDGSLQDAMAALNRCAEAWVQFAAPGQVVAQRGDAEAVRGLVALSRDMSDDVDPLLNAALGGRRPDGCLYLSGAERDRGVLLMRTGGRITLACLSTGDWVRLAPRFGGVFGTA